jgi:hypothetical protein
MTGTSVADERLDQVETLQRRLAEVARRAKEHPELLPAINTGLQDVISGKQLTIPAVHPAGSDDPLADYRRIKNLVFNGPDQWNLAATSRDRRNRNPLGLPSDWCPRPVLPYTADQMKEVARFCKVEKEWQTRVILHLALPRMGSVPLNLNGQYDVWGVEHDNMGPGRIRRDAYWSNWYRGKNYDWADELPVIEPIYIVGYEHARWITGLAFPDQQKAAQDRNMAIATAALDAQMLNVARINGKCLRETTYSRTCTLFGGEPLDVYSGGNGVRVNRRWNAGSAGDDIAASVQGVPSELGF